jgi:hypothetical protein
MISGVNNRTGLSLWLMPAAARSMDRIVPIIRGCGYKEDAVRTFLKNS